MGEFQVLVRERCPSIQVVQALMSSASDRMLAAEGAEYCRSLPASTQTDFKNLIKDLLRCYRLDNQPHVVQKNLFDLRQETTEDAEDLADRVQH